MKMNLNKKLSKKIISQCKVAEINIKFPLLTELYNNKLVNSHSLHVTADCSPITGNFPNYSPAPSLALPALCMEIKNLFIGASFGDLTLI